jgi:four helix bundle protein
LEDWRIGGLEDWKIGVWNFFLQTGYILRKSRLTNKNDMRKELEDRLVNFATMVINMRGSLEKSEICENLFGQIARSSTSAALNYGEALGAESRKDFAHKIGIVLKEIRESHNNLRILSNSGLYKGDKVNIDKALDECNQLVAIFHKTALTLKNKS